MDETLKPCPCCGSDDAGDLADAARAVIDSAGDMLNDNDRGYFDTNGWDELVALQKAVAARNRRAEPQRSALVAEVLAIQGRIQQRIAEGAHPSELADLATEANRLKSAIGVDLMRRG